MVLQHVFDLCQGTETVSSILAREPTLAPGEAVKRLYGKYEKDLSRDPDHHRPAPSHEAEESAFGCGRWGPTTPTPLFLQALADSLNCLDADPMAGVVSPPLMASYGTMPLTVIAPLADVIRHVANLMARAEREVIFVTCSWSPSLAQRLIRMALIELSRRAGIRGQRVVVKIMFDKASFLHVSDSRHLLKPEAMASPNVQLPEPEAIPHLDLEVMTQHQLMMGTLHAKFCVVDRRIAAIMSNNVEDNPNMEMLTHVEGPIVDSIYDSALVTWDRRLTPALPSHRSPAATGGLPLSNQGRYQAETAEPAESIATLPELTPGEQHYDADIAGEMNRMQSLYSARSSETVLQAVNRRLNMAAWGPVRPTGCGIPLGREMIPYLSTGTITPVPMALVSRGPHGSLDGSNTYVPQNEAWLSLLRSAKHDVFIQTPDLNAGPLVRGIAAAVSRGVEVTYYVCFGYNDAGEVIPGQGGTNDQVSSGLVGSLPEEGHERELLRIYNYVGRDQNHPIHQCFGSRTCHVKVMIADGAVGVMGSGNQDTQSWSHSQEMNVMVDSRAICEQWREGIERNQNTRLFGRVSRDGVWRDSGGRPGIGYMGNPGRVSAWIRGVAGMLRKMSDGGNI